MAGGERAQAPAAEEVGLEEPARDARGTLAPGDAAPQEVPRVRGDARHGALLAVEREGVEPGLFQPVALLDAQPQRLRFAREPLRVFGLTDRREDVGECESRREEVALQLDRRDR